MKVRGTFTTPRVPFYPPPYPVISQYIPFYEVRRNIKITKTRERNQNLSSASLLEKKFPRKISNKAISAFLDA